MRKYDINLFNILILFLFDIISLIGFLLTGKGFARCGTTNDELRAWKKSSTCENLPGAAFNPASCETHVVRRAFFSYNFSFFVSDKVNNFFLSHGKSPTKILINFPKMFCAIFLQTSCTLLKYSRTLT